MLIEEMLQPSELDRLLRDSFANYVIQTALDYANPSMKTRLIEAIRPYLPAIRTTPYGRRIQAKIQGNEGRSGSSSGQATPSDAGSGQVPLRQLHQRALSNASSTSFVPPTTTYANGFGQGTLATTRAPSTTFPSSAQVAAGQGLPPQQPYAYGFGRGVAPPPSGNYF